MTGESVCNANVFNRFACQPLQCARNTPASHTQSTPLPVHCPLQLLPARCTRIAHNHRSTSHKHAPLRTTQPTRSGAFGSTNAGTPTRRRSTRSPTAALKHDANEASPTPTHPEQRRLLQTAPPKSLSCNHLLVTYHGSCSLACASHSLLLFTTSTEGGS